MGSSPSSSSMQATLEARSPRLHLAGVGPSWFGGHQVATQISNAMHLLFPAGERFFVRSVLHYEDRLSPGLAAQVRAFCKQEGRHAQAHERFFENLRARGYDIDAILARYEHTAFAVVEKNLPPALRLSITVALEHFTAMFAADALSRGALDHAEQEMADLLAWHAVEELEHKAVAFDVLCEVAPSHALRIAGLLFASAGLLSFWLAASRALLAADGIGVFDAIRALRTSSTPPLTGPNALWGGLLEYLHPDFHPNDVDHSALIARTLADLRTREVIAAPGISGTSRRRTHRRSEAVAATTGAAEDA